MVDETTIQPSRWNYAQAYLQAIREIENECIRASMEKDFKRWLSGIKAFYREVHRVMKDKEREEAANKIKRAEAEVNRNTNIMAYHGEALKERLCTEIEVYLKDVLKRRGMALPTEADPGRSLLEDRGF